MIKHTTGFLLTLGALMLAPAVAQAELPRQDPHGSAALLLGYGFKDGANLGFGARGGYTFDMGVYVGGTFVYHLGKSTEQCSPAFPGVPAACAESSFNIYYLGVEGGYDFQLDPVVVRPYLGLGPAFLNGSVTAPGFGEVDVSSTEFGFWLGGTVLYNLNEQWFIGGDFKLPIVDGEVFPTLAATGGLNF